MTDLIEELYPKFLDMGYSPSFFWECSLAEVMDLFESFARREERRIKEKEAEFKNRVISLQVLALQIREAMFPKEGEEFKTIQHYYPDLFPQKNGGTQVDKQLLRRNENLRQFAEAHNKRWRQAHGKEGED
ncbi:MAG: hypothetical protein Q4C58_14240 [Eubacteriales bacterium]|nr:hypothetical protein [Eubacteriales bacterium]